jgi:hypothetical protein
MGHELEIHPLMVIFALMVGWEIGGLVGIYLLVPVIAVTRVIWRRFVLPGPQAQTVPMLVPATPDGVFQKTEQNFNARATAGPDPTGIPLPYGAATTE